MTQRIPDDARAKVDSIYVADNDRFVVSLIVGYRDEDLDDEENGGYAELDNEGRARVAAKWALGLTTDEGSHGTQWHVLDRETGETYTFEQESFAGDLRNTVEQVIGTPDEPDESDETHLCPACKARLGPGETHWSIFPEPMGGYVCPQTDA